MRSVSSLLLAALAVVALSSCLAPVETGAPVDAGTQRCASDSDCAAPVDRCDVLKMTCTAGHCTPVVIQPGTCPRGVADCDCNAPPHERCTGAFDCVQNRCVWKCTATTCASDRDCAQGSVCEPGPDCQTGQRCVPGCHEGLQCRAGEVCLAQDCKTCPCPGQCATAPTCSIDADCPPGSVCDFDPGGSVGRKCLPGCHMDTNCGAGKHCEIDTCADCVGCPCVGACVSDKPGCTTDAECPAGRVCAQDWDCSRGCVLGCRTEKDCRPGETCMPPLPGSGCGYDHGTCAPAPKTCSSDSECPGGMTCGWDQDCKRTCVPGCRGDAECGPGEVCAGLPCDACTCNNPRCQKVAPGCSSNADCPAGQVCGEGPDCSRLCVPGCRGDAECGPGESCAALDCDGCGCATPQCRPKPGCTSDASCGPGAVCEFGTGCAGAKSCVAGCHTDSQCGLGERCEMTPCTTCPCPGTCRIDPCLDADRDGYAWSCRNSACPGLRDCDCDDNNPAVHPQAAELCGNGRDEDCDGTADEGCACSSGVACVNTIQCNLGQTFCQAGCCTNCPVPAPPACPPNMCSFPGGVDTQGCPQAPTCGNCCSCPGVYAPVCGTNYATYSNACQAACAGVPVLHDGACLTGEGLACGPNGMPGCPAGQYCRDLCPVCDYLQLRCTQVAACAADWDCPAGLASPPCSKGPGTWTCVSRKCQFSCP